jgi:CO/xanthine dehydrogenase FAD-binding subunit
MIDRTDAMEAVRRAQEHIHPIDDVRASAWYRRELVHNIMRRMLDDVAHH